MNFNCSLLRLLLSISFDGTESLSPFPSIFAIFEHFTEIIDAHIIEKVTILMSNILSEMSFTEPSTVYLWACKYFRFQSNFKVIFHTTLGTMSFLILSSCLKPILSKWNAKSLTFKCSRDVYNVPRCFVADRSFNYYLKGKTKFSRLLKTIYANIFVFNILIIHRILSYLCVDIIHTIIGVCVKPLNLP